MKELFISGDEAGMRLENYLKAKLPKASNGFLYKMLRKKNITLNNKKAAGTERLCIKDSIQVWFSDETYGKFSCAEEKNEEYDFLKNLPYSLDIIHEEKDFMLINKPAGILSQKASQDDISLNEHLRAYLISKKGLSKEDFSFFRPSVANRLDFGTSGVIAASKTRHGAVFLSEMIKKHSIQKDYICLVHGVFSSEIDKISFLLKDESTNKVSISDSYREGAHRAETIFRPGGCNEKFSLVHARLVTGKSHQIRAQLSGMGYPIVLDSKYGALDLDSILRKKINYPGQCLHARRLVFPDGRDFYAPVPDVFYNICEDLVYGDMVFQGP